MSRVAAGDTRAFEALFARHRSAATAVASRICGPALAEEAVQDAFLQISRAAGSYEPSIGTVRTWVLGIVRLRAIDTRRRDERHSRRRIDVERLESLPDDTELEASVARRDEARTVRELLERLPADQARAIRMAYFGQLTHQEIAGRLELPIGTVKGRIRLGLLKLREPLDGSVAVLPA